MLGKALQIVLAATLATGTMTAAALATEKPATPDWAVKTLGQLSAADLDITTPAGKAFLTQLNPKGKEACAAPLENRPDFDQLCSWALNNEETDFDILLGIKNNKIVSFIATYTPEGSDVWACEKTQKAIPESELQTCNVRSADEKTREQWSASWESYIDSIN